MMAAMMVVMWTTSPVETMAAMVVLLWTTPPVQFRPFGPTVPTRCF
jgi:hypothetical protein